MRKMGVTQEAFMQFDVTQVLKLQPLRPDVTKLLQFTLTSKQHSVDLYRM